jgi:hypothetical protein
VSPLTTTVYGHVDSLAELCFGDMPTLPLVADTLGPAGLGPFRDASHIKNAG